jgi:CDGSH-type Zn-finger protein
MKKNKQNKTNMYCDGSHSKLEMRNKENADRTMAVILGSRRKIIRFSSNQKYTLRKTCWAI